MVILIFSFVMIMGGIVLAILLSPLLVILYYVKPGWLLRYYFSLMLYLSGMRKRTVQVDDLVITYAERGHPKPGDSSIVFVHGFSASKDMWTAIVRNLPKDLHVLALDLPGHGESGLPDESSDLHIHSFIIIINNWLQRINMEGKPIHLVGTSFGGALCLVYAADYPVDVERLTLICPAIQTPVETDFYQNMRAGRIEENCPLIPNTPEEVKDMLSLTLHNEKKLPKGVYKGILALRQPRNDFFRRLFGLLQQLDSGADGREMEDKAHHIKAPTQIIWGENDKVLHVSGARRLQDMLPNCVRVDIFENCGHSSNLDQPEETVKVLREFHNQKIVDCWPLPSN